jgi:hypothetical protein
LSVAKTILTHGYSNLDEVLSWLDYSGNKKQISRKKYFNDDDEDKAIQKTN